MHHLPTCAFRRVLGFAIVAMASAAHPRPPKDHEPSFGGDPANGSVLLNSANAQNSKSDPKAAALCAAD
ncbi:MAG: curli assembly protein CsgF [Aquabacterium sp.]